MGCDAEVYGEYTAFIYRLKFYTLSGQLSYENWQWEPLNDSVCVCRTVTTGFVSRVSQYVHRHLAFNKQSAIQVLNTHNIATCYTRGWSVWCAGPRLGWVGTRVGRKGGESSEEAVSGLGGCSGLRIRQGSSYACLMLPCVNHLSDRAHLLAPFFFTQRILHLPGIM